MSFLNEVRANLKVLGHNTRFYPIGEDVWRLELESDGNGSYYDLGDPQYKDDNYVAQYLLIMYIKAVKAKVALKEKLGQKAVKELERLSVGALMSTKRGDDNEEG